MAPKWYLVIAAVAMTSSALCAYLARPKVEEGGLDAPNPVYDFGELSQGEKVTAQIELVNNSSEMVQIEQVLKSCDCAAVRFDKWQLAPKEQTIATLVWKIGSKRNRSDTDIFVVYKLGNTKLLRTALRLEADVVPDIQVSSQRLVFPAKRKTSQTVVFSPGRMSEFSLDRAFCTQRAFTAVLHPEKFAVEVSFDPEQWPDEAIPSFLRVETTSTHERTMEIELLVEPN